MMKVDYTKIKNWYTMAGKDMGEEYEEQCHRLLDAALEWQEQNPDKNPRFMGMKNVMGLLLDDNEDAKSMEDHMLKTVGGGCSGAMFQQSISHFFFIMKNGLDKYYEELNKRSDD